MLRFLLAAATSHVSGSIGGGGGSSGIGVMGSGSAVLISSTATLVAAALVAIQAYKSPSSSLIVNLLIKTRKPLT